jgi:hypothetical protein
MSNDDPFNLLRDFIYWMRKRRPLHENPRDAWVSEETLEYVAQGVERFLEGKNPWPKPRGRKAEPDMMWKCYYLTCVVDEHTEFPPRHFAESRKNKLGIYTEVGERLGLSGQDIERHARNARKQLETPKGTQEYQDWLDQLEERWWCYHAVCIEKRALKLLEFGVEPDKDTLFLKHNELEEIVKSGQELRNTEEGMREYNEWLARYNRRDEDARIKPLRYRVFPFDHPESKALREQRAAAGLSNGKLKSTRIK